MTPEEMQQRYRNVFGSSEGKLVLGDIANMCHAFDSVDANDPVLVTQRNVALVILQMAGALDSIYLQLGIADANTKENDNGR